MKIIRVAVIDDEEISGNMIKRILDAEGFEVETFLAGQPFLIRMRQNPFQLVFIDLNLPDHDGMEILRLIKQAYEETEAIIITGHASIESAVEATQKGAFHYLTKPSRRHDILLLAKRAKEKILLQEENKKLKLAMGKDNLVAGFVGNSPAMQEVFAMVKKVAMVNCNVLLQAETGTGKQMVARAIHALSPRMNHPFVYFNCGGFTEELICSELFGHEKGAFTGASMAKKGLFEAAAGGTVLLDEIGEMPLSMQIKLLHVLQEREVLRVGGTKPIELDIRIIAATNKDLKLAIQKGSFRDDLFYRLNVVGLHLPRLAERRDDIPLLISHFIAKFNMAFGKNLKRVSSHAMELLLAYDFPGNVRELENIIQRGVALAESDELKVVDLPVSLRELAMRGFDGEGIPTLEEVEERHIEKVLKLTGYNNQQTSSILGIPRTTLWRRMRKYGLSEES
ncbi:MAG: sigma-54 dependent transcriptional regulator [Desulfobulbaceae bacterium]|nr:sigma-54 dependent transcriptional regulator [Desulfobulbaceae bacterium]